MALGLLLCGLLLWAFAPQIGKALGRTDNGNEDPDAVAGIWWSGIPGTQSPGLTEAQFAATGIGFMLFGSALLIFNARWLFHTLIGK